MLMRVNTLTITSESEMELFILSGILVISFGVAIERTKFKAMLLARDAKIIELFAENNAAENAAQELINER